MVRSLGTRLIVVAFVASGLFVAVGVSPAGRVLASCPSGYSSCTLEHSNSTYADIYEGGCNCYIRWYWELDTYTNNGWPNTIRHYEMTVSTGSQDLGAGAVLVDPYVRVWVCGTYAGEWSNPQSYWYRSTEITGEFIYNVGCSRQADDGSSPTSYVQGPSNWSPQTVSRYINQG